jgi:hypothetical protein
VIVTSRLSRFFQPRRQQLQIEQIGGVDGGRPHRLHLLERQAEANAKLTRSDGFSAVEAGSDGWQAVIPFTAMPEND